MNSKRVVFIFRNMGTGGAQKIEAFVANTLLEEGYDVVAINMSSSPCTVNLNKDIKIVDVLYDSIEKCSNKLLKNVYKCSYIIKLRKKILSFKPDIVCAFLSDVVRITVLAMKGSDIPIIGSERGDPYFFTEKQFNKYRKAYLKCKSVVFQLDDVAQKYNLPISIKQKVIPNPCIPRKNNYCKKRFQTNKTIIAAGRLTDQKRFDLLIDAFEIVKQRFPEYQLHIYGDGPLKEELELKIQKSFVKGSVLLVGDVDDVFNIAVNAEFFVLSSDFEGIPNVILESMAAGIPCISTDCSPGGARFLLKNGECGLIVPRNDKEKLAEAMIKYIMNPTLRSQNSEKGLMVVNEFNPYIIGKMWTDVFKYI